MIPSWKTHVTDTGTNDKATVRRHGAVPAANPQGDSGPESTPEAHPAHTTLDSGAGHVAGQRGKDGASQCCWATCPCRRHRGPNYQVTLCVLKKSLPGGPGSKGEWSNNEALGKQRRLAP